MPKIGFLLGAGASFPFGIPMMRQFFQEFLEYIATRRSHCSSLVNRLVADASNPDLEVLIERIEQVRAIRNGLGVLKQSDDILGADLDLADELRGYLDMFLIETCERFDVGKVKTKLTKFVDLAYEHDAFIFTTNYDRLIEVAALEMSLPISDGFEPASSRPESKWSGEFSTALRLLKLHGSVNWYEEEESRSLFRLERGYSLPSHQYRLTHGQRVLRPLMIIPTLEKAILKQPYAGLLMQFGDALKEVELFIVIGNSLRDDHLRNTLAGRADGLNILLVNPASRDQTGIVNRPQTTHPIPLGMEQFVEFGLDPLRLLIRDLADIPREDHCSRIDQFAKELALVADTAATMTELDAQQLETLRHGSVDAKLDLLRSPALSRHAALIDQVRGLALDASDESISVSAIDALVDARGPDAAEVLAEIALRKGPLPIRAEAALALQSLRGGASVEVTRRVANAVAGDPSMASLFAHSNRD